MYILNSEKNEVHTWVSNDEGLPSASYTSSTADLYHYDNTVDGYYRNKYESYGTPAVVSDFMTSKEIHTHSSKETHEYIDQLSNDIYKDPNPQVIHRAALEAPIRYEQQVQVRYLQPPAVPPPGVMKQTFTNAISLIFL